MRVLSGHFVAVGKSRAKFTPIFTATLCPASPGMISVAGQPRDASMATQNLGSHLGSVFSSCARTGPI